MSIFPSWHFPDWRAVDDRLRGGSSISHLDSVALPHVQRTNEKGDAARFWGHLDIDTLGGAGFASQRYIFGPEPLYLPLETYKGITITVYPDSDRSIASNPQAKTFTLVLKTPINPHPPSKPKLPTQPEPSTLSYEANFTPSSHITDQGKGETLKLPFNSFKPTYRGREVSRDDPKYQPLHTEKIYEFSLMCRSSFGNQKGDFGVIISDISGWKKEEEKKAFGGLLWSIWSTMWTMCAGMFIWMTRYRSDQGRIQLPDEEKDTLL